MNSKLIGGVANGTASPSITAGLRVMNTNHRMENVEIEGGGFSNNFLNRLTAGIYADNGIIGGFSEWKNVNVRSGNCSGGSGEAIGILMQIGSNGWEWDGDSEGITISGEDCNSFVNSDSVGIQASGILRISNATIQSGDASRSSFGIQVSGDPTEVNLGGSGSVSIRTGSALVEIAGIYMEVDPLPLIVKNTTIATGDNIGREQFQLSNLS